MPYLGTRATGPTPNRSGRKGGSEKGWLTCLGLNLAHLEMCITLAKILFTYNLQMVSQIEDWSTACKCYDMWKKPELMVRFHPCQKVQDL